MARVEVITGRDEAIRENALDRGIRSEVFKFGHKAASPRRAVRPLRHIVTLSYHTGQNRVRESMNLPPPGFRLVNGK